METTELQVAEEKMALRGPKARWVLKEKLALLVLLERRYIAKLSSRMLIRIDQKISVKLLNESAI